MNGLVEFKNKLKIVQTHTYIIGALLERINYIKCDLTVDLFNRIDGINYLSTTFENEVNALLEDLKDVKDV